MENILRQPLQRIGRLYFRQIRHLKYQPVRNYSIQYLEHINKDAIKTIIDGGFCNGIHSFSLKKQLKNLEQYYALEPLYETFKNKDYSILIENEDFVKILPFGLWNEAKEIEFCQNVANIAASRIAGTKGRSETGKYEQIVKINTITIDKIKQKENIKKVDYIKMDIEGAELPALQGGEKTIIEDRPQLAISIYHSLSDFISIPLYLNDLLDNYTFRLGHYSYDLCETVLQAIPNELISN